MSRMCFEANVSKFEISKESARQIRVYNQCAVKKQAASGSSSRELEGDIHVGGTYMLSARMHVVHFLRLGVCPCPCAVVCLVLYM